ncbi:MAG: endonuclease III [Opitutales bacterium]
MTKKERAEIILREFNELYPEPKIPLDSRNTFTFLIAVLLSAQCTDKRVNEVTPKLFDLADSPEKMMGLSLESIEEIIRPCGFFRVKAKNIKKLSKDLVDKFEGIVPDNFEDLESLAGVGHKTASVLMQQSFNKPAFPVDTHIHRLATRWKLSSGKSVEQTEADLKKLFAKEHWHKLHLQFIYYGREYCQAHSCKSPEKYCKLCKQFR